MSDITEQPETAGYVPRPADPPASVPRPTGRWVARASQRASVRTSEFAEPVRLAPNHASLPGRRSTATCICLTRARANSDHRDASSPGWPAQGLGPHPTVVVVACGGDVVVVVVDDVVEVVVVVVGEGFSVVGGAFRGSGATTMARWAGAVVDGIATLVEVVWSCAVGLGAVARE
jgi:hypothetical protein